MSGGRGGRWINRISALPEFNIFLFGVLLNFVWELLQMPLFAESPDHSHYWTVILMCGFATIADGVILLIAFWVASGFARSRGWIMTGDRKPVLVCVLVGLAITCAIELLATANGIWHYSDRMPQLFGIGLSPFFQWVFPPLITLWLTKRQMAGIAALSGGTFSAKEGAR